VFLLRARRLLEIGLGWPQAGYVLLRSSGLQGGDGLDAARRLAAGDPDARIRRLAHKPYQKVQPATGPGQSGSEPGSVPGTQNRASAPKEPDSSTQPSLFDP
jgi:hypothetical protein